MSQVVGLAGCIKEGGREKSYIGGQSEAWRGSDRPEDQETLNCCSKCWRKEGGKAGRKAGKQPLALFPIYGQDWPFRPPRCIFSGVNPGDYGQPSACMVYSSALQKEKVCFSETPANFYQTTNGIECQKLTRFLITVSGASNPAILISTSKETSERAFTVWFRIRKIINEPKCLVLCPV